MSDWSPDVGYADLPYTPALRAQGLAAAQQAGVEVVDGGCDAVTQGPRLETHAEIARMRRDGCDLVGMTGMPEAGLARELGLDHACLAIVANWAAGAGPQIDEVITLQDVLDNVEAASSGLPGIGRAHVGTPVTNEHIVCRFLLEKKKT